MYEVEVFNIWGSKVVFLLSFLFGSSMSQILTLRPNTLPFVSLLNTYLIVLPDHPTRQLNSNHLLHFMSKHPDWLSMTKLGRWLGTRLDWRLAKT